MNDKLIIIFIITGILAIILTFVVVKINILEKHIKTKESQIIALFFSKVAKIPALVEIMKKYTKHPDIFEDIIYLHKLGIIYNIDSIYSLLEINFKIYKEFEFLMKLSAKIPDLHKNGNFLYTKNNITFLENNLEKEINNINGLFEKYNNFLKLKNLTIIGLLFPFKEKVVI